MRKFELLQVIELRVLMIKAVTVKFLAFDNEFIVGSKILSEILSLGNYRGRKKWRLSNGKYESEEIYGSGYGHFGG
jgi:hypothetical protein